MVHNNKEFSVIIAFIDRDIAKLVSTIINNKYNARIDTVYRLSDFCALLSENDYDIILLDFSFTDNMIGLVEGLKNPAGGKNVPVVLFTSYALGLTYNVILNKIKVFDFLVKPFNIAQLYAIVDFIMYKRGYINGPPKRRYFRMRTALTTKYRRPSMTTQENASSSGCMASSENVSPGGICLVNTDGDHNVDDELELDMVFSNSYGFNNILAKGKVKWIEKTSESTTFGLEFVGLNNCDRVLLSHSIYS